MTRTTLATAILLTLITATGAFAASDGNQPASNNPSNTSVLFTPPLVPLGPGQLDCYIVNVSNKPRAVRVDVFTREGVSIGFAEEILAPGTETVATVLADEKPRYCRFIVDGPAKSVRASGLVRVPTVGSISALEAH